MITELATGTTEVSLPDYYKEALIYNLAIRIADEFDYQLLPTVIQIAITSKNTVENMVALDRLVKTSKMDDAMTYILYRG